MLIEGKMTNSLNNYFSPMDIHFGNFISSFGPRNKEELFLAAALTSRCVREGHICLNLNELAGKKVFENEDGKNSIECPSLPLWLASLNSVSCVGKPGDFKPLILNEDGFIYLHRYWQYEKDIAEYIRAAVSKSSEIETEISGLRKKLSLYFDEDSGQKTNWQKIAAVAAMLKKFFVISGSPGTGKTTAITKIMALILDTGKTSLRIALAAPTGKAAARLQESVNKTKEKLNCPAQVKEMIPDTAQTIHRLLGSISNSPYFRFNKENPLPYDLVVIDEASMVDLPLLAKLIAALRADSSLILLGDRDQLASVEVGVVLGDICSLAVPNIFSAGFARQIADLSGEEIESDEQAAGLQDHIIHLQRNYRFSEESGIGYLSRAVKNGDARDAVDILRSGKYPEIRLTELTERAKSLKQLGDVIIRNCKEYMEAAVSGKVDPQSIFELLERFRILCALRVGIWGTENINVYVERTLREAGLIKSRDILYEGLPVMILQNDYRLHLFNGDIGIILKDPEEDNQLRAFFRDEHSTVRKYLPSRLPHYETAWAMTVHKSQGSEFESILLVLSDLDVPLITRELIYTGVTRASQNVDVWAGEDVLMTAIQRRISRQSGLADALREAKLCK